MDATREGGKWPLFMSLLERVQALFATADRHLQRRAIWLAAIAFVFALQSVLILRHWPWPDEYQALQLAIQAPDIPTLFDWLRYEGHPPLWYFLLRGLGYLCDPLAVLPVAALLLALPTQAMILFASPFSRAERLAFALSEFVLFDFLTISRSQTLGVAIAVLALVLWQRRSVWLAITLLPFCDFLFGVISGIFVLLKWREKRLWWPGVAAWLVSGLAAAWTVRMAPDAVSSVEYLKLDASPLLWFTKISSLAIPFQGGITPGWNAPLIPIALFAWAIFLAFAWVQTRSDAWHRLMLFGLIALTFIFSTFVYPLGVRHLMLIALLLILLTWLRRSTGEAPGAGFRLWLCIAALSGLGTAAITFVKPFDTAHLAVREIRRLGLEDKHWMAFPDWRVPGIAALSGMQFERSERQCMMDFVRWDSSTTLLEPGKLEDYLRRMAGERGRFYLLSTLELNVVPADILVPLADIEPGYDGLGYYLYLVGPDAKERPVSLPDCVPGKRKLQRLAL